MKVSPSILACDFSNIELETKKINNTDCEYIHLDVMDGEFVPNKTFDYNFINTLKFNKIFDTHLMIKNPLSVIEKYYETSDIISFHVEAETKESILDFLKNKPKNKLIGLSIKPKTDVSILEPFLPFIDMIMIMTVEPGFGGQKFMPENLSKVDELIRLKTRHNYSFLIEVDGGVNGETAKLCKACGVDIVVAGTYIFKSDNYQERINMLR